MDVRYRAVNISAFGGLLVAEGLVENVGVRPCGLPPNSTILGSTIALLMVEGTQSGFCRRQPYDAVPERRRASAGAVSQRAAASTVISLLGIRRWTALP
jgi:hypothetical protein